MRKYLPFWAEVTPNILLPLCPFEQEQMTVYNILGKLTFGTNVLHGDPVV